MISCHHDADFELVLDPAIDKVNDPPTLFGAPSGDSLLASWDAQTDQGGAVETHRLDCVQAN